MKNNVQATLHAWLNSFTKPLALQPLVVAYSGGRDSHVLLHALHSLRSDFPDLDLSAIHINHGLQPLAKSWASHCEQTAAALGIYCQVRALALNLQPGQSIEEEARKGRYRVFKELLNSNQILLTAHTEDDQAETVLLQLMRGAGPKGLAAMASLMELGQGKLARPLLCVSRQSIAEYANTHQLSWIEDPTNQDPRFARNFLRLEIFPSLQRFYPGSTSCLARSAEHIASMVQLLEETIEADFRACLALDGMLDIQALKAFANSKQIAILRMWLQHHQLRNPTTAMLKTLLHQILTAKMDAKVTVSFGNITLYRYQNKLYWEPSAKALFPKEIVWDISQPLFWAGKKWLARKTKGQGLRLACSKAKLTVKARQGGERCRLQGDKMTRSLKKILQNEQIPFWQRGLLPLFYLNEQLVCIGNRWVCEGWQVTSEDEFGWIIEAVE